MQGNFLQKFPLHSFSKIVNKKEVLSPNFDDTYLPLPMILRAGAFLIVHGFFEAVNAALM